MPLRVCREKVLEGLKPAGDALGEIQSIHREDHLASLRGLPQILQLGADVGRLQRRGEPLQVHTQGKRVDRYATLAHEDLAELLLYPQQP